ncbi:MAG: tetratricopeptide repeat protein [Gemmatimonadaceae bacterium]
MRRSSRFPREAHTAASACRPAAGHQSKTATAPNPRQLPIHLATGDLEQADEHELRAIGYATGSNVPRLAAISRTGRAEIALRRGDAPLAETTAQLVIDELQQLGDPLNEADALRVVGAACAAQRRYDDALQSFSRALEIARAHGHALIEAEVLRDRVDVRVRRAERALALDDARAALAIFERLGARAECDALGERIAALA